ncbi:MAG TPA: carboxypeptidase-like regulatory domain-containing protein [Pyrinomonadaceae bacterium]|nr:carboxypeptidase-like regulatory domain-containing protein [Pyrinomonadaceae bacterium]
MIKATRYLVVVLVVFVCASYSVLGQTTGSISGVVTDEKQAVIPNATVTVRNTETNLSRTTQTDNDGNYRFGNLPVGSYEVTVETAGFSKHVQSGITLLLNQAAVIDVTVKAGGLQEVVNVVENAALLNTTSAEVSTRFDSRRLSELPLGPTRNILSVALSAPGVSQLGAGQTGFAAGISYSSNGGRVRSNNFMVDGQDNNEPGVAGAAQPLNNPDLIQEVRLITNQFLAEYGRNSSSVFNAITKAGTNDYHGSAFWFHNGNALNACSNTDKRAGFCNPNATLASRKHAPFRIENQIGGTIGGPLHLPRFGEGGPSLISGRNRTFFFGSYQRWSDRQLGSGTTLNGAPTEAGRAILQAQAGNLPQVQALLRHLPAAQAPINASASFTRGGQTFSVPLGSLTGSTAFFFDNHQASFRVDHNFNNNHIFTGRYLYADSDTGGTGQATPEGLTTNTLSRQQTFSIGHVGTFSPTVVNEIKLGYQRFATTTAASDPKSEEIPSLEISELGLIGFNAAASRTAIGLAVNLPQFRTNNIYQIQDNLALTRGEHNIKLGTNIVDNRVQSFFVPTIRGLLRYATLNAFVNDFAEAANINKPLPGGEAVNNYQWYDIHFYGQDEWKMRRNFTLTYGLRYERPGEATLSLLPANERIVGIAGGDARFAFTPVPKIDRNNFQPRIGFNWNPRTDSDGILGFLTGGDRLVFRGGYAVTHDYTFINIALNVASSFPFIAAVSLPATTPFAGALSVPDAFTRLPNVSNAGVNPNEFTRTIVGEDFRSPYYQSFIFEAQRELGTDVVFRLGYVGSKGSALFQTLDGNPRRLNTLAPAVCTPTFTGPNPDSCRVNPRAAVVRLRANAASSIYHSLQASFEKRLSRGFSGGLHYTWSSFIDQASEVFNPSSGEVAVSQDSFDRSTDRGRSAYDRPHRLSGNFLYELPFFQDQKGFMGHLLGGWQVNGFFTFQSGAPFTVLNGSDPAGALAGINTLVGDAIRPNLNTNLALGGMTIPEIIAAGGAGLFQRITAAQRVGNAGRNILRADGINNLDLGIFKNTRIAENQRLQIRAEFNNATNTRDFGIPEGRVNSANFLNQWGTNGGNRRIVLGLRYIF